jgi:RimJ/RimL family protein N-acetyltransferase
VNQPLYAIRVRTPRLELRLPTHDELVELREVARAGVHPPEEMPFYTAWTDLPYSEEWVVAFHESLLTEWKPERWTMTLAVFHGSQIIGSQGAETTDFARSRTAGTGSWLGMGFQRQGFGTEMRAGMLELLFNGLGAEVATSGTLDGNPASARVAEKLGSRMAGRGEASPRGEPVGLTRWELRRADWRPPIPVELEGVEPALPLFGL